MMKEKIILTNITKLSHYRFKIINYAKKHSVDNEGLRSSDSVVGLL
jgi:hypothetical protein